MKSSLRRNMYLFLSILVVILFSMMSVGVLDVEAKSKKKHKSGGNIGKNGKIYGCYKKNNGQLRLVNNHRKCKKSERPITFNNIPSNLTGQLACVTGMMRDPDESSADIMITSQENTNVSDWSEVFNPFYIQQNPYAPTEIIWGLQCKDDWINTGCTQGSRDGYNAGIDRDIAQFDNGCYSDNEEVEKLVIFATCCKVIPFNGSGEYCWEYKENGNLIAIIRLGVSDMGGGHYLLNGKATVNGVLTNTLFGNGEIEGNNFHMTLVDSIKDNAVLGVNINRVILNINTLNGTLEFIGHESDGTSSPDTAYGSGSMTFITCP